MFTRSLISPSQTDLYGRVQSETTDICYIMVTTYIFLKAQFPIFPGDWSRWVIRQEVNNGSIFIASRKKGLIYLPVRGWLYRGVGWPLDDTLTLTGRNMSCLTLNK